MRPADAAGFLECEHQTRAVYAHPDETPWTVEPWFVRASVSS